MARLTEVTVPARTFDTTEQSYEPEPCYRFWQMTQSLRTSLAGGVIWNVTSNATAGAPIELLRSLIARLRGARIDARWIRIQGPQEFSLLSRQLHRALHGVPEAYPALDGRGRDLYEHVLRENARELLSVVCPGDLVILHGPQTAGLCPHLARAGARVIWQPHAGDDPPNEYTEEAFRFLDPYLEAAHRFVFTRKAAIPSNCDPARLVVIPPTLDPLSPKNQELDPETIRSTLVHAGILEGPPGIGAVDFVRSDGSPARVNRGADVIRLGSPPSWSTPLVVQISRWDRLKDPLGVMKGFVTLRRRLGSAEADLVLAGPNIHGDPDEPEAPAVFNEVVEMWQRLPYADRQRIQLVNLPTTDPEENAAIVNALQRHAVVVVQKSLYEGPALAVAEAMWKSRPVVASAVGGIADWIEDGKTGLLLQDPGDLETFAQVLHRILEAPVLGAALGQAAHERIRQSLIDAPQIQRWCAFLDEAATCQDPPRLKGSPSPLLVCQARSESPSVQAPISPGSRAGIERAGPARESGDLVART